MEQRLSTVIAVRSLQTALLWLVLGMFIVPSAAVAASRHGPSAQEKAHRAELINQRNQAWNLFYSGKYEQAADLARTLASSNQLDIQMEMGHLLARCHWEAVDKRGRTEATKIWGELQKGQPNNLVKLRLNIARALELDDRDKTEQAITLLEGFVRPDSGGTATAELAIELGRLYVKAKRFEDTKKALDFVVAFLNKDRLVQLEITEADAAPFVQAAKDARDHLNYDANAGLADFEKAEKLRAEGKFKEAAAFYKSIIDTYPDSTYAPRSELSIGHCLVGIKQLPQAAEHWRKFIAASPSGPWRGQAHLALIDLSLEGSLDLEAAAKQAELSHSNLAVAMTDEASSDSWKAAAFDIVLRLGMVQLTRGKPGATEAFAEASQMKGLSTEVQSSLQSLIVAASSGRAILPSGLTPGSDIPNTAPAARAATALTLGGVYLIAHRFDSASALFDRVAQERVGGATRAQVAYAFFGKAAVLQGQGKWAEAKDLYQQSIRTFADGSWHDETLYRLAMITTDQAERQFASPPPDTTGSPNDDKPPTAAEVQRQLVQRRAREAKLLAARGESLPYWNELVRRFPDSPRAWTAYYNAGVLLWQLDRRGDAADVFGTFVKVYPQHPLAGEAHARLIDMALETTFNMAVAQAACDAGLRWVQQHASTDPSEPSTDLVPWRRTTFHDPQPRLQAAAYAILLRAGLVAYLDHRNEQATSLFRKAADFDTSDRVRMGAETSMDRMIAIVQGKTKPLMPDELLPLLRDDQQRAGVALADLYLMTFNTQKACDLYLRLLQAQEPFPRPTSGVEAYLLLRVGQSLEFLRRHDEAIVYLKRLYAPQNAKYPWTADGIFRVGTWIHNTTQDPKEAMTHWQYVFTRTPNHPEAERSLFYFARSAERMKEYQKAAQAYQEYIKRYPEGRWTKRIQRELLPQLQATAAEAAQQGKGSKR